MRRVGVALCVLLAGCGGAGSSTGSSALAPTPTAGMTTAPTSPTPAPVPSFSTPEAAMRYLASAWNRGDLVELKHVTDPSARGQLLNMHREATDLRLERCTRREQGDYECTFKHGFPVGYQHASAVGKAGFLVGPARRSGWYMTVYEYCGG